MSRKLASLLHHVPKIDASFQKIHSNKSFIEELKPASIFNFNNPVRRISSAEHASDLQEEKNLEQPKQYSPDAKRVGRRELFPYSTSFADIWDPWVPSRSMRQMLDMVDRTFDNLDIDRVGIQSEIEPLRTVVRPPWDAQETEDAFCLRVDMPGLSKEEVKVHIEEGDVLVIRGEHKEENSKDDSWRSSRYGSYQTRVELPDNCQVDQVKAELEHGVLTVTVPKSIPEQKVIEIPIS